mmetsp:Transcript_50185/g.98206  ORF Transcript_50185/g.98206 Transcript_50185/m.98206 type:complete len:123 (+) Transcript_50185:110-478(+)
MLSSHLSRPQVCRCCGRLLTRSPFPYDADCDSNRRPSSAGTPTPSSPPVSRNRFLQKISAAVTAGKVVKDNTTNVKAVADGRDSLQDEMKVHGIEVCACTANNESCPDINICTCHHLCSGRK